MRMDRIAERVPVSKDLKSGYSILLRRISRNQGGVADMGLGRNQTGAAMCGDWAVSAWAGAD